MTAARAVQKLPANLEAETSILGAILVHNEALATVLDIVTAADFHLNQHREIFNAMLALREQSVAIDLLTLKTELGARLEDVGGAGYIAKLADGVPKSTNVDQYARIVAEDAQRRSLIYMGNKIVQDAYAGDVPPAELAAQTSQALAAAARPAAAPGVFRVITDGYHLAFDHGIEFTVDRLRRERHELIGELSVACGVIGAKVIDGVLSVGTFNLSSPVAASHRAKLLAERARVKGIDWSSMIEELRQHVLTHDRRGAPSINLRTVAVPAATDPEIDLCGLSLPADHFSIVFGDGGTGKSYLALRLLSELATDGMAVGLFDWELSETTHRRRLEAINGAQMPDVRYVRLDRPLVHEVDRLRRIIRTDGIRYAVLDSIGYGTAGAPESAEAAMDFARAVRQLGIGTLALAHVTKAENGDQRPFGSTFWHNSARCTWNLKLASTSPDGDELQLAAFHRKSNLGRLRPPVGIKVAFEADRVVFVPIDATTIDEVASELPLWQRIRAVVRTGPMTLATIASEVGHDNVATIDRVVRKYKRLFTKVSSADGVTRVALVERRTA